jgi:hypothetical protein
VVPIGEGGEEFPVCPFGIEFGGAPVAEYAFEVIGKFWRQQWLYLREDGVGISMGGDVVVAEESVDGGDVAIKVEETGQPEVDSVVVDILLGVPGKEGFAEGTEVEGAGAGDGRE